MADLITGGAQGGERINDVALHDFAVRPVLRVEILEDGTDFGTVNMETKDDATPENTLAWQASVQIAGTGIAPVFGTNHQKGEFISGILGTQRFVAIKLNAGSIRVYH